MEWRFKEANAKLKKQLGQLKKKPYYQHIVWDANGNPVYLEFKMD